MTEPAKIPLHSRDGSIRAFALVDSQDYERLPAHRWSYEASTGYATRGTPRGGNGPTPNTRMHRDLMGLAHGDPREVDHINLDKLDYRRSNLRIATRAEQMQNLPARENVTSRFRGVSWYGKTGRWRAHCQLSGRQHHLGYFASEEDANETVTTFRRDHMPYSAEARA